MPLAIIITLEKDLPQALDAYRKASGGKAIGRECDKLDFAARCQRVPGLTSMLSENQTALIEQLKEQGFDPAKMRLPPEQWYEPKDGLKTIAAVSQYVSEKLNDFKQPNPILRDLKAAEALLNAAAAAGVRFHFTKV